MVTASIVHSSFRDVSVNDLSSLGVRVSAERGPWRPASSVVPGERGRPAVRRTLDRPDRTVNGPGR